MTTETITVNDILDLLPIVAYRGWRSRRYDGSIRSVDVRLGAGDHDCPVCALTAEIYPQSPFTTEITQCGGLLDIRAEVLVAVAHAADYPSHPLRARLEAALGVTP